MSESGTTRPTNAYAGDARIDEAAQDWLLLFSSGNATADDRARFEGWMDADPRHQAAYEEVRALWHGIDDLRDAFARPAHEPARPGHGHIPSAAMARPRVPRPRRAHLGRRRAAWGAALTAACLVLLVAGTPELALHLKADHRTAVGEQAQVMLPDGSIVWLNTDTALAVDYDDSRRQVTLLRGEALFQAVRDPEHPFSVRARGGQATALGTVYSVRDHGPEASVMVEEGSVAVVSPAPPAELVPYDTGARALVNAGYQVRYREGSPPGPVRPVDTGAVAAWRDGFIAIRGLPLAAALAEIDRYRPGGILLLADPASGEPVTARLSIRSLDDGLEALAATHGLRVTHLTAYLAIIH